MPTAAPGTFEIRVTLEEEEPTLIDDTGLPAATLPIPDKKLVHKITELMAQLRDKDAEVRNNAENVIGEMGPEAIPVLVQALNKENWWDRAAAAEALSLIDPTPAVAVSALMRALKDREAGVRSEAAYSLGNIGAEAKVAVEPLKDHLSDVSSDVRSAAHYALERIDDALAREGDYKKAK